MYTLWIAKVPGAVCGHDGAQYPLYLNGGRDWRNLAAFARDYALLHGAHVVIERADFATAEERDDAEDQLYESINDAYIAEGERRADAMWAATHDEPGYLLIGHAA
jgi:hypothetical protein